MIMASDSITPDSSDGSRPMQAQSLFDDCIQHPHLAQICIHTRSAVSTCYCTMLLPWAALLNKLAPRGVVFSFLFTMLLLNQDNLIDLISKLVLVDTETI